MANEGFPLAALRMDSYGYFRLAAWDLCTHSICFVFPILLTVILTSMKLRLALFLIMHCAHTYAQKTTFPQNANTFVINDSSLNTDDLAKHFIKHGFLLTHKDEMIVETEYKMHQVNRNYISILCNRFDGKIYVKAKLLTGYNPEGNITHQIRNIIGYVKDFNFVYSILTQLKPNISIQAVVL